MEKYEPLGVVGEGSYGVVLKCRHRESGRSVAIKKFIDSEDDQNVRKIALREIRVLRKLHHENLVNLLEVFRRRKHLYLVFEFIDHTLLDELEGKAKGLEPEISRKYIYQILRGLGFCHDNNIIHRDVKPENVLVSKNGIVKLCDFGFARNLCGPGEQYTDYVATRWYRAPELLVGDIAYGKEVDIWAVGCLFAEMMSGEPLFPGDSDIDQLFLIAQRLGRLARRHLSIMSRNSAFRGFQFPKSRHGSTASTDSMTGQGQPKLAKLDSGHRVSSKGSGSNRSSGGTKNLLREGEKSVFAEIFPNWSETAVNFLTLCLDPEPSGRPGCSALLRLPYFVHDNFPSRFISELNQKLQLEGRRPIPAYSTRKKRSILGSLQGANVTSSLSPGHQTHNVAGLTKKNPLYQARLNLSEETSNQSNHSSTTTKYTDTFSNSTPTVQKQPAPTVKSNLNESNQPHPYKFSMMRDQTFLVDKGTVGQGEKSFHRRGNEGESSISETRIPSLLSRKYSDDSLLKHASNTMFSSGSSFNLSNGSPQKGSKSTPNIVAEENLSSNFNNVQHSKEKRYSMQNSQPLAPIPQSSVQQPQPRKFSFSSSFPPPEKEGAKESRDLGEENGNGGSTKLFQPLPVTTLTFSLQPHNNTTSNGFGGITNYPYSLSISNSNNSHQVVSKSPSNNAYLNVTSYNNQQSHQKKTPSPKSKGASIGNGNDHQNINNNNNNNSSYFPHTHFSTNQSQNQNQNVGGGGSGIRYPVSFYQTVNNPNPKSLPVSVFGSSMVLKNQFDVVGGEPFLPRMTGKTFTSSGNSVKEDENSLINSNFLKTGTNSLPRRRDSIKWDQSGVKISQPPVPKGVSKHNNDQLGTVMITSKMNNNARHFSTYDTQ